MHAVELAPPPPPPGGAPPITPAPLDDGDVAHLGPPLADLLVSRGGPASALGRVRLEAEDPEATPRVVLAREAEPADDLAKARKAAVHDALRAAVGPLALAFACQGNWLMRGPARKSCDGVGYVSELAPPPRRASRSES